VFMLARGIFRRRGGNKIAGGRKSRRPERLVFNQSLQDECSNGRRGERTLCVPGVGARRSADLTTTKYIAYSFPGNGTAET